MAPLLSLVARAFGPISDVIDQVHTSDEERLAAKQKLFTTQAELFGGLMDYEQKLAAGRARIIEAEARGHSPLQRNWRPLTMLTFLVLVVCDAFGWLPFRLATEAWTLLQIGLGGYVVGRSVEKVAPRLFDRQRSQP
ncbi:MAG: 3TM-type holin [Leptospirillia bacterium]